MAHPTNMVKVITRRECLGAAALLAAGASCNQNAPIAAPLPSPQITSSPPPPAPTVVEQVVASELVQPAESSLDNFWKTSQKSMVGPPLAESDFAPVEKILGAPLPTTFKKVMLSQNGGSPRRQRLTVPLKVEAAHRWLSQRNYLLTFFYQLEELIFPTTELPDRSRETKVILFGACDTLSCSFCLFRPGTGDDNRVSVGVIAWSLASEVAELAPTFDQFQQMLFLDEKNDCYGVECPEDKVESLWEQVVGLFKLEGVKKYDRPDYGTAYYGENQTFTTYDAWEEEPGMAVRLHKNQDYRESGFPDHPLKNRILRLSNHPRHRAAIQATLKGLPYKIEPVFLVDWKRWGCKLDDLK